MRHGALIPRYLIRTPFCAPTRSLDPVYNYNLQYRHLLTLAIETSCDDTCVAILERHDRTTTTTTTKNDAGLQYSHPLATLHFDEKITAKNTGLGGIHPLEALDSHRSNLAKLVDKSLFSLPSMEGRQDHSTCITSCRDGSLRRKPDFVSVTRGPGMRSNLAIGLEMAKGLAVAWQVPLVGVHHMQAHALTPRFVRALDEGDEGLDYQPEFSFLTLLVSGGHTMLLHSTGLTEHKVLVTTADIAIGDALDRSGWLLLSEETKANLRDTAFGKYLSQYAFPDQQSFQSWPIPQRRKDEILKPLNQFGWQMQTPLSDTREMKFSFGSIESRVDSLIKERKRELQQPLSSEERLLLARTAIGSAFEHLGSRTILALENLAKQDIPIHNLVVSGGVAANDFLRYYLRALLTARGFEDVNLVFPPVKYCTDNAAMIAWAGIEMYEAGFSSDLGIGALRRWSMDAGAENGGILGVGGWQHRIVEDKTHMPPEESILHNIHMETARG